MHPRLPHRIRCLLLVATTIALMPGAELSRRSYDSEIMGRAITYSVYVPPDPPPTGGWPLVLVLHGLGRHDQSLAQDPEALAEIGKCRFVIVCTNGTDYPSERFASFKLMVREVLQRARAELPVSPLPSMTGICGWSMGGYGAIRFAQAFPEDVAVVGSSIGILDQPGTSGKNPELTDDQGQKHADPGSEDGQRRRARIAGVPEPGVPLQPDPLAGSLHPAIHAEKLRGKAVLIIAATEAGDYQGNLKFHRTLTDLGIPAEFHEIPGKHTFASVRASLPIWFEFMAEHLRPDGPQTAP